MSQPDYYQLLGVSVDASAADAWRILSDPAQRAAYDRMRSGTDSQGGEG